MKTESFRKVALTIVWPAFACIVLFGAWMIRLHLSQPTLGNAVLFPENSRSIQSFSLVDHNGRIFDKQNLLGKWSFVFFGYTRCPDVCPMTLQTLGRVADMLEVPDNDVQFIFVSVDPERDSSEHLKNYVGYFNNDFMAVSGEMRQLAGFSDALGAIFGKGDDAGPGSYIMSHSAQIFLISPNAERYALLPHPHKAEVIVKDFYDIRSYYERKA